MSLTPEQIAEELAIAMFTLDGVCSDHDWVNANATARAHYRECARACVPIIERIRTQAVEAERARVESYEVKVDPTYRHFGLIGEPTPHEQHPNQRKGLDLYVSVINFDSGERCWKKLYENTRGLHFKHTGYSPMYLDDFTDSAIVVPFQVIARGDHLSGDGGMG